MNRPTSGSVTGLHRGGLRPQSHGAELCPPSEFSTLGYKQATHNTNQAGLGAAGPDIVYDMKQQASKKARQEEKTLKFLRKQWGFQDHKERHLTSHVSGGRGKRR